MDGSSLLATPPLHDGVHVVHELVDQRDGDLLDLALGVGHLAHEDVAGGVNAALGVGVEHRLSLENQADQLAVCHPYLQSAQAARRRAADFLGL